MDESPQSYQAPSPGAIFLSLSKLVSDTGVYAGIRYRYLIPVLERLGTLLGLPVLVVLPTYVMTRLHLIRSTKRHASLSLRENRYLIRGFRPVSDINSTGRGVPWYLIRGFKPVSDTGFSGLCVVSDTMVVPMSVRGRR